MSLENFPQKLSEQKETVRALTTAELHELSEHERDTLMGETAVEIMTALSEAGGAEYESIIDMYKELPKENLIVRREDPQRILNTIKDGEDLTFSFPPETRYSNAVMWQPELAERGLQNAYNEGYGMKNGIVTVVGFRPSETLDVQKLKDASQVFAGLDRQHVYSVAGAVRPEDIVFTTVRIPIHAFPREFLTEEEADILFEYEQEKKTGNRPKPVFVQRGYLLQKQKENRRTLH